MSDEGHGEPREDSGRRAFYKAGGAILVAIVVLLAMATVARLYFGPAA